jgi:hypothetical protein
MPNPIVWDESGERYYETGVEKGVLYVAEGAAYPKGVAWNGLINVAEKPSGAEATPLYADNIKYLNLISGEDFAASVEAYYYPDEFAACDGSAELVPGVIVGQQARKTFGMSYVTKLGNDVDGAAHGYKIHLIYGCTAAPSEKSYGTVNESPEAITFSWEMATTPVNVPGMKPTACITINSTKLAPEKLKALEDALYGTNEKEAYLPLPAELATMLGASAG